MWNAILEFAGWALFYLLLLFYIRWIVLEREFFSRRDPKTRESCPSPDDYSLDVRHPAPDSGIPLIPSSGIPA